MKKLYYVIDSGKNDEWTIGKFESKEEAIKEARSHWDHMSDYDKKESRVEVRDYAEDIEAEDCNNFDYDVVYSWNNNMYKAIEKAIDYLADVQGESADPEQFNSLDTASLYINDYIMDNYGKECTKATTNEIIEKSMEEWERYINEQMPKYY